MLCDFSYLPQRLQELRSRLSVQPSDFAQFLALPTLQLFAFKSLFHVSPAIPSRKDEKKSKAVMSGSNSATIDTVKRKIQFLQQQADEAEEKAEQLQRELDSERQARERVSIFLTCCRVVAASLAFFSPTPHIAMTVLRGKSWCCIKYRAAFPHPSPHFSSSRARIQKWRRLAQSSEM